MAYSKQLADRIREYLARIPDIKIEEKPMFSGLCFMVNSKMCINVSGDNLMCRFDAQQYDEIAERAGFKPVLMRGRELKGYCYVTPDGFQYKKDFEYWLRLCLGFNKQAKSSKKKK